MNDVMEVLEDGSVYYYPLTMRKIRQLNPQWFSPASMRFFNSRVHGRVYGDGFFVTSEAGPDGVRCYSVRQAPAPAGEVRTIGEFMAYATSAEAHHAASRYASGAWSVPS